MFVRPRRGLVKAAVLATATIGLATSAHAQLQNAPVDLEIFRPAMDSKGFVTDQFVGGARAVGLFVRPRHVVRAPAVAAAGQPAFGMPAQTNSFSVDTLVRPSLQAAVGFTKLAHLGIELGIILPMGVVSGRSLPDRSRARVRPTSTIASGRTRTRGWATSRSTRSFVS